MSSPLLKEVLLLTALVLVTPSLADQVEGQTQRLRQDTRRAVNVGNRGRGNGVPNVDSSSLVAPLSSRAAVFDPALYDATPHEYTDVQVEFLEFCEAELLDKDGKAGDGIISQKDFADTVVDLCETFPSKTFAECPRRRFSALDVKLELIFAFGVCPDDDPMVNRMTCLQGLKNLDGFGMEIGYMVTSETIVEAEEDVAQLCFRLFEYFFPPVGGYSSVPSSSPTDITSAPSPSPTDKPTNKPTDKPTNKPSTVPSSSPSTTPLITPSITSPTPNTPSGNDADFTDPVNDGDGSGVDSVNGEEDPVSVDGDNSDLGTGPVIGIAAAAAACLLLCVLVACRRRFDDDEEPHKELRDVECDGSVSTEGAPNLKFLDGFQMDAMADTGDKGSIASSQSSFNRRSILQFDPLHAAAIAMGKRVDDSSSAPSSIFNRSGVSGTTSAAQITKAIDKANWDEVYNLASQLAEQEDLSTLSSIGRQNSKLSSTTSELSSKIRDALSPQDQERTRALDQLVDYGDWTGVAVTAALYAGESGSMSGSIPSTQRSFLDLLTGKRGTSNAAAAATDQDTLSALPVPFGNALGTFTDETRSATTDEPGSFDLYSPSWTQPAPSSPVLRAFTTPPAKTKRARTSKGASPPGIVTAFSSSSSGNPSVHTSNSAAALGPLKGDIDRAVEAGDWEKVLILSSQVESNATYQANLQAPSTPVRDSIVSTPERASASGDVETSEPTTASLKEELSMAVYHGDWALVSFFANRIMSNRRKGTDQDGTESATSSTIVPQSTALVPFGIQAARSIDTTDTEAGKKKTIERLVLAEKWNGVVIMAGLYDLESKGSLPTSDARSRALVQRDNAGEAVSDGKSAGWTDILDRSNEEITPNELKSPDNQISPPPQFEKEKVHLRKVARKFPESQQHQSENVEVEQASLENRKFGSSQVPPTELRHADRVTGDISLAQLTAAPLREAEVAEKVVKRDSQNRASLHGTQELIPYWQKREAKNASDDAKPAAK